MREGDEQRGPVLGREFDVAGVDGAADLVEGRGDLLEVEVVGGLDSFESVERLAEVGVAGLEAPEVERRLHVHRVIVTAGVDVLGGASARLSTLVWRWPVVAGA